MEPKDISRKKDELFGIYLDKLKSVYSELPEENKLEFIAGLELIVSHPDRLLGFDQKLRSPKGTFNGELAKKIRKDAGLSMAEVSKITGISQSFISNLENSKRYVTTNPNSPSQKYLKWLADQGYNPCGIELT